MHTFATKQQPAQPESQTTTTTTNSAYPFTKLFGRKQPSLAPFVHPTLAQDVDVELFFLLLPALPRLLIFWALLHVPSHWRAPLATSNSTRLPAHSILNISTIAAQDVRLVASPRSLGKAFQSAHWITSLELHPSTSNLTLEAVPLTPPSRLA